MEALLQLNIHKYKILFIFWNIFLALIPCLTVYYMAKAKKLKLKSPAFIVLFLFWLFMLPNTAYLFFMVRHVVDYCPTGYNAYRVCMAGSSIPLFFFVYALLGIPTFYYALSRMTKLMKMKWFPLVIVPLTSIGLMFGLYERFNSWDLLKKPLMILQTGGTYFTEPHRLFDFLFFTAALYFIYYGTEYLIKHDSRSS